MIYSERPFRKTVRQKPDSHLSVRMSFDRCSHFRKRMQRYSFYTYTPNKSSLFFDLFYRMPYISLIFNTLPKPVSYRSMTAAPPCTHLFPEATDTILSTSSRPPGSSFFPSGDEDGIKKASDSFQNRRLWKNGDYLLSHCYAVPSA